MPDHPLSVLIVEDNQDGAELLALYLRLCGHKVELAFDGDQGIRAVRERRFDVVLCDIGLPGRDGFEVARVARQALGPDTLLVAVTAYGSERVRRTAREAGFDHFFQKPASPEALEQLVREFGTRPRPGE